VCADRKVLIELDDCILTIAYDPQGEIDQQLSPQPNHLLNIILVFSLVFGSCCVCWPQSLIELDGCILTIACDPQGKIDQQLNPHPIQILNFSTHAATFRIENWSQVLSC
jgi:hypothetical protein